MESPQKTPKSFDNNKMYISATDIIENTNPLSNQEVIGFLYRRCKYPS